MRRNKAPYPPLNHIPEGLIATQPFNHCNQNYHSNPNTIPEKELTFMREDQTVQCTNQLIIIN
jgi:hypothetical protein